MRSVATFLTDEQLREAEGIFRRLKAKAKSLTSYVDYALENYSDPTYHSIDVNAFLDYDSGEFSAWQSGTVLLNLLQTTLASPSQNGRLYIFAHSMGNIVTGEALRLGAAAGVHSLVAGYAAVQAAAPAQAFDSNVSTPADFWKSINVPNTSFPVSIKYDATANIYPNWFASGLGVAKQRTNFYNVADYALNRSRWVLDQLLKPDTNSGPPPDSGTFGGPPYGYVGDPNLDVTSLNGSTQSFFSSTLPSNLTSSAGYHLFRLNVAQNGSQTPSGSLRNQYEIFGFAGQPRSNPLGTTANVGLFGSLDLQVIWGADPFSATDFSEHVWHSAEFRFDCTTQKWVLGSITWRRWIWNTIRPVMKDKMIRLKSLGSMLAIALYCSFVCVTASDAQSASKADLMRSAQAAANQTPITIFGRVVDQFGAPVAGAHVTCGILIGGGWDASSSLGYGTTTSATGAFQFLGLHGERAALKMENSGYEFNWRSYLSWWADYVPDSANPAIFVMYKLQGSEPMIKARVKARVPINTGEVHIDLLTGKQSTGAGDLAVRFSCDAPAPSDAPVFGWTLEINVPAGGLTAINDRYPNVAPSSGYSAHEAFAVSAGQRNWVGVFHGYYYFSARNGSLFGRIRLTVGPDANRAFTNIEGEVYENPNGSRNLEYNPGKRIIVPGALPIVSDQYEFR